MSQEGHWYVAFEVLSPGDESIDFEEFSDIRNSDGTGPGRAFRPPKSKSLQSFNVCIPSTSMSRRGRCGSRCSGQQNSLERRCLESPPNYVRKD